MLIFYLVHKIVFDLFQYFQLLLLGKKKDQGHNHILYT